MPENDILTLAESGQAEELRDTLRQKCDFSLYYFAKTILGYKDMSEDFHGVLCRDEVEGPWTKKGFLWPRGHLKSTIITKSRTLWRLIQDRERRFLFVGESDKVAKKNLNDIKWHIENNQILKWLYPEIVPPDFNATKWTDTEILLPREGTYDEPSIMSVGVGAKVTGFHFTDVVYDDIFGEIAASSPAEAERIIEWIQYAPGLLVDPETSCEAWVGTRWKHGNADVYGWIMENMPYVEWHRRAAVENGKPIWPERYSLERLKQIEAREGIYKYSCQYMNDPTPPEGSDFAGPKMKYYYVDDDKKTIHCEDGSPDVQLASLTRISFYDPSAGGASATAENSICVMGQAPDRRKFVLDSWAKNCGFTEAIEKWHGLNDQFILYKNHYELVGAQKVVEEMVRARRILLVCPTCKKQHRILQPIPVKPEGGSMNKDDRIRLFAQDAYDKGEIYFRRTQEALRNQVTCFPHTTLKDRVDTWAYCIRLLNLMQPPRTEEEAKASVNEVETFNAKRQQRCNTDVVYGGYV